MAGQPLINKSMRAILVDWLVEVAEEYHLVPETLYLSVNYIDRVLSSNMMIDPSKLQLVGISCMLIASKMEEIYPPEITEFVYITNSSYTEKEVCDLLSDSLETKTNENKPSELCTRWFITRRITWSMHILSLIFVVSKADLA